MENSSKRIKIENPETLSELIDIAWTYKGSLQSSSDVVPNEFTSSMERYRLDWFKLWRLIPVLEELNEMIGMESLKNNIVNLVLYYAQGFNKNYDNEDKEVECEGDMLHTVLLGDPGTGKTTAANILAKIYAKMGFLSKGHVVSAKITDFVGKYVGHSEHQTKDLLNQAKGGVLFIDETYNLSNDCSFATKAVNILNAFLSEEKKDIVCIIAGYESDLNEKFFSINKGLRRRFPWTFTITEYSSSELLKIFEKIVNRNYWSLEITKELTDLFTEHRSKFKYAGGDMETLFAKCKFVHTKRIFDVDRKLKTISYRDVELGIKAFSTTVKEDAPLTYFM